MSHYHQREDHQYQPRYSHPSLNHHHHQRHRLENEPQTQSKAPRSILPESRHRFIPFQTSDGTRTLSSCRARGSSLARPINSRTIGYHPSSPQPLSHRAQSAPDRLRRGDQEVHRRPRSRHVRGTAGRAVRRPEPRGVLAQRPEATMTFIEILSGMIWWRMQEA
jgi:hypothetical protein